MSRTLIYASPGGCHWAVFATSVRYGRRKGAPNPGADARRQGARRSRYPALEFCRHRIAGTSSARRRRSGLAVAVQFAVSSYRASIRFRERRRARADHAAAAGGAGPCAPGAGRSRRSTSSSRAARSRGMRLTSAAAAPQCSACCGGGAPRGDLVDAAGIHQGRVDHHDAVDRKRGGVSRVSFVTRRQVPLRRRAQRRG